MTTDPVPPSPQGGPAVGTEPDATVPARLHPLTPVATALPMVVALFVMTQFIGGGGAWQVPVAGIPAAVIILIVGSVVLVAYRYLLWQRFEYWFDSVGDLRIDSGLFYRNERKVQLSRLQAVDIERPLLARVFGLATLKIDIAGTGDSKVMLAYLSNDDALMLRVELLSRAQVSGQPADDTTETVIHSVAASNLLMSLLLRTTTALLLALTALIFLFTFATSGPSGLLLLPLTGGIPLLLVVTEFFNLYGFTVAKAHDGVRLRYGLLRTQSQTVPMGRVMAVEIIEPLLWRRKGWVRVRLTIAGVAGESNDGSSVRSILLPVSSRAVADEVLSHVLPGVDVEAVPLVSAPQKTRWRAPIQGARLAFGHNDRVFVSRHGRVTRHLCVVPHARTQSVSIVQGPWERSLGLSTLRVDIPPGPIKVEALHFPAEQMKEAADAQVIRARTSRSGDWASGGSAS